MKVTTQTTKFLLEINVEVIEMVRKLPPELQSLAEKELNENPNETEDYIRIVKEWIAKEPHLIARIDDQWILSYLRGCKFSVQTTKQKIDYYYSLRSKVPEIFGNRDPLSAEMLEFLDKKIMLPLDTNTRGPQIYLTRLGVPDIDHISIFTITKLALMMFDVQLYESDYVIAGQYLIIDVKGISMSRAFELSLNQMKIIISLLNAYPVRIKKMIFLNCPEIGVKLAQPIIALLKKKLAERIFIFANDAPELVSKLVPHSILPIEYGGEACLDKLASKWKRKMEDYQEWFREDARYSTDESKRVPVNMEGESFGVNGTFRKLECD